MPDPDGVPSDIWAQTMRVHDAALASATRDNYDGAVTHFQRWCAAERITYDVTRSIPEPVLCAYAASLAGVYSGGTARSKLAGLRFAHEQEGRRWLGSARLKRILKSVALAAPRTSRRDDRPAVTAAMLDEALVHLDPLRPFDTCVAAAMLVMFWCQLRGGEVLSATRRYDYDALPTVKCLRLRADAGGKASQVTSALWLPRTKVEREGVWVWIARHFNDPSYALSEHIAMSRLGPDDPLFAYRHDKTDCIIPLTRNAFLSRLNEIWAAAGMQRITLHCFRIGGTTALLRAGVDPEVVKMAGRWRSDSFLRYWRELSAIISSHVDLCDVYWRVDDAHVPQY